MERCCCCNARLKGQQQCRRCQADLSQVIETERMARYRLGKAIQFKQDNQWTQSIAAVSYSLQLKKTPLAIQFRQFLIQQLCRDTLNLLTENQLLSAKRLLNQGKYLVLQTPQLQQLNNFTDYLLIAEAEKTDLQAEIKRYNTSVTKWAQGFNKYLHR